MNRAYAEVIGDPISHSKSPLIHTHWLEKLGLDADYRARHVRPEELASYLEERRGDPAWRGCNVTIPHKEAVLGLLDDRDARARAVGAVNTVIGAGDGRLAGTNTDVDGVGEAVGAIDLAGRDVVVIGAGGAARSAFAYLADRGCASVRVLARTPDKALRAARECGLGVTVSPFEARSGVFGGAALVINATQLGMSGQAATPAFVLEELNDLAGDALVFDMVYAPLETDLLRAAARAGRKTADGLTMLIGQAAVAFERFFGAPPPRGLDADLRARLTA